MSKQRTTAGARTRSTPDIQKLLEQYGCGPIQFTGTADSLYERHLLFDNVLDPTAMGARERYEAVTRSVRDVLSQRLVRTETTYERLNPKRVYYLSMEFLIGRSLANNIMNLLLDREVQRVVAEKVATEVRVQIGEDPVVLDERHGRPGSEPEVPGVEDRKAGPPRAYQPHWKQRGVG